MRPLAPLLRAAIAGCLAGALVTACGATPPDEAAPGHGAAGPRNTVLWISLDGLRPDYLERAETPFLDRLRAEGAFSHEMRPVFPPITFSSHVSQATGVQPETHGITGNSFYDSRTGRIYRYPGDMSLLEAEPIWITASRQNVRTAVLDWPLAHNQRGPVTSDYFGERYERGLEDEERLERLLDLWDEDQQEQPLRLVMGYLESPDREGHRYGPDDPQVSEAVERVDAILGRAFERAVAIWERGDPGPGDHFYLVLSSDHGMSAVRTLIHPGNLTGLEGREDVEMLTSGNVAHLHLDRVKDEDERESLVDQALSRLAEFDYARGFRREEIPAEWGYRHPARTGDLLVVLESGYTFSTRPKGVEQSVEEAGGPLGMHGYDPATNPEMGTPLFIFRAGSPIGGEKIGRADALQMHATICDLLGIEPAAGAVPEPIRWEPSSVK